MIRSATLAIALLAAGSARAADVDAGKTVFNACKICHTTQAGAKNGVGPNLHGLFGRKAGTYDDFQYSAAMKNSGIVWDDETLAKYIRDPKGFVPQDKMAYPGLHDDAKLADLLAYLKEATK
jgi:cytochrome c